MSEQWTRQELVTVAVALEEFRDESGPGERALAERVNAVLRGAGDHFVLMDAAEVERLRNANVALRQALVRIEGHARQLGDDALAGVALIARDAINENG